MMLNGLIDFPWRLRKKSEPEIYDVCCPQCGWRKTIELGKVDADSRCIHGEEPAMEIRETLPVRCPECSGKLKKRKIELCHKADGERRNHHG